MADDNRSDFALRARQWTKGAVAFMKKEMEELGQGRLAGRPWREALRRTFTSRKTEPAEELVPAPRRRKRRSPREAARRNRGKRLPSTTRTRAPRKRKTRS